MRDGPSHKEILLVAALYLAVALAGTWPVARAPATQSLASLTDNDFRLNIYLIFWGAHALVTDPLNLHHTNMFHPERYTFAYSEMELAHSLLALPLILAGGGPHLVYNLLLIVLLTVGPVGFYLLARDLLGGIDRRVATAAALFGGLIYAWNPVHFTRYQQIQLIGDHWMPWFAWAMLRWLGLTPVCRAGTDDPGDRAGPLGLEVGSVGWAATAGGFLCLQALSGSHNAVFGALLAAVTTLYAATIGRLWTRRRFWFGLGVIATLCVVVLGPVFYPYVIVEQRMSTQRSQTLEELLHGSAAPLELLSARSNFYRWLDAELGWPSVLGSREVRANLFPGVMALFLAGLGVLAGRAWRDRRACLFLVFALLAFLLALGPRGGLYLLVERLPVLRLIRVPSRFMLPTAFGLSVLATWGVAWLLRRGGRRLGAGVLAILVVLFAVESAFAPLQTRRYDPFPGELYVWLGQQPGDFAVAEFPLDPHNYTIAMRQVFRSIHHWKKLLVGYSGFQTESNVRRLERLNRQFPRDPALHRLEELDVRYVVVLEDRLDEYTLDELEGQDRLEEVRRWGAMAVYRLRR